MRIKKRYSVRALVIIVCSDRNTTWTRPFDGKKLTDIDASIITDHMMMEATDLGLGSVWICYFKPDVLKKEFVIPEGLERSISWRLGMQIPLRSRHLRRSVTGDSASRSPIQSLMNGYHKAIYERSPQPKSNKC